MDSKQVYNEIVQYLKEIAPELIEPGELYEEPTPLFDKADIEPEIRDLSSAAAICRRAATSSSSPPRRSSRST